MGALANLQEAWERGSVEASASKRQSVKSEPTSDDSVMPSPKEKRAHHQNYINK